VADGLTVAGPGQLAGRPAEVVPAVVVAVPRLQQVAAPVSVRAGSPANCREVGHQVEGSAAAVSGEFRRRALAAVDPAASVQYRTAARYQSVVGPVVGHRYCWTPARLRLQNLQLQLQNALHAPRARPVQGGRRRRLHARPGRS